MREIGIPWSDPMVLALIAGTKTQTRRKVRAEKFGGDPDFRQRYRVGDLAWGREAWGVAYSDTGWVNGFTLNYRADKYQMPFTPARHRMLDTIGKIKTLHEKWRPPMFFPRWASRLLHQVTAVRAERLLDITEADARAEGIEPHRQHGVSSWRWPGGALGCRTAREAYLAGYDTLHGEGAAQLNPWVWVITFRPWDSTLEHEGGCVCAACRFAVQRAGAEAGW